MSNDYTHIQSTLSVSNYVELTNHLRDSIEREADQLGIEDDFDANRKIQNKIQNLTEILGQLGLYHKEVKL